LAKLRRSSSVRGVTPSGGVFAAMRAAAVFASAFVKDLPGHLGASRGVTERAVGDGMRPFGTIDEMFARRRVGCESFVGSVFLHRLPHQ
jgi:hypothetical protein